MTFLLSLEEEEGLIMTSREVTVTHTQEHNTLSHMDTCGIRRRRRRRKRGRRRNSVIEEEEEEEFIHNLNC